MRGFGAHSAAVVVVAGGEVSEFDGIVGAGVNVLGGG